MLLPPARRRRGRRPALSTGPGWLHRYGAGVVTGVGWLDRTGSDPVVVSWSAERLVVRADVAGLPATLRFVDDAPRWRVLLRTPGTEAGLTAVTGDDDPVRLVAQRTALDCFELGWQDPTGRVRPFAGVVLDRARRASPTSRRPSPAARAAGDTMEP